MRVLTSAIPHARSVTVSVFAGVGSRYEQLETAGISHVVEHLLFKGTERRPAPEQISGAVEGVGGIMNAGTEQELTVYYCKVARQYMGDVLDLLFDMVRNSLVDPKEVKRERLVVVEELNMINDFPNQKVEAIIDEMLWPDHPLGRDIGGTRDSVMAMTRETVVGHVAQYYSPTNMVVSVAGNVDHDEVVAQVADLCGGWAPVDTPGWGPFTDEQDAPRFRMETRKTEQSHLAIALPGVSSTHPDRYALDLLSVVLGEGMSSRLFVEVREKRGLAYDIHSATGHFSDCGVLSIGAGVDPKRVYEAVETILAEVALLREGVPEEELEKAKRLSTGTMLLRMEDTRAVSHWMGGQELLLGKVLDVDEVVASIEAVTTDDLDRVAGQYLVTEKLNMAVVGPSRGGARFQRLLKL
jgi:predicted Zn-dependent peptidase